MWNDSDIPLAYLITFRCYGTWLHGDSRGSTDRFNNAYRSSHLPDNKNWEKYNKQQLNGSPLKLEARARKIVENAIRETCSIRGWSLWAINVRTNHVHAVVCPNGKKPEIALNAFKSNATRKLRETGLWNNNHSPWADKGSNVYLWNEKNVETAVEYVVSGQGGPLPDFD